MKGMIYKRLALVLAVVSVFSGCVGAGVQYRHNGDFYYFEKRYQEAASGIARRRSRETHKHRIILALCMTKARV